MNTKPRNSKIVKMQQNEVEINLDSAGTETQLNIGTSYFSEMLIK